VSLDERLDAIRSWVKFDAKAEPPTQADLAILLDLLDERQRMIIVHQKSLKDKIYQQEEVIADLEKLLLAPDSP
jgi:hypothetical protein